MWDTAWVRAALSGTIILTVALLVSLLAGLYTLNPTAVPEEAILVISLLAIIPLAILVRTFTGNPIHLATALWLVVPLPGLLILGFIGLTPGAIGTMAIPSAIGVSLFGATTVIIHQTGFVPPIPILERIPLGALVVILFIIPITITGIGLFTPPDASITHAEVWDSCEAPPAMPPQIDTHCPPETTASMLVTLELDDATHRLVVITPEGDAVGALITPRIIEANEMSVVLPLAADEPLQTGEYAIYLESVAGTTIDERRVTVEE